MAKLKLSVVAKAQQPQLTRTGKTRRDGWGYPLQTIYLWRTQTERFRLADYDQIRDHQFSFYRDLKIAVEQETDWFYDRNWQNLPKIFNDPVAYNLQEIITDTENHYKNKHDPCLSMLLRQQYLVDRLAEDLGSDMVNQYGIEITFKNQHDPVLAKFWSRMPKQPVELLFQ